MDILAAEDPPPVLAVPRDTPKGVRLARPPVGPVPDWPVERSSEPNSTGMALTRMGRSVGRQMAMTPTESSRKENVAASTLSQVGSVDIAAAWRVRMR
jgi:hypothetical protein